MLTPSPALLAHCQTKARRGVALCPERPPLHMLSPQASMLWLQVGLPPLCKPKGLAVCQSALTLLHNERVEALLQVSKAPVWTVPRLPRLAACLPLRS
jgi:hypothetical protein